MENANQTIRPKIGTQHLLIGLLFLAFLLAFYPVWRQLVLTWYESEEYSHGFLIIPVSLYIIWTKRDRLMFGQGATTALGFFLVVLSLLIYIFSQLSGILTLQSVSMMLFIFSGVYYLFGAKTFKQLLFPLLFLLFMIPIPSQIYSAMTIPLQLFVSKASVGFVKLLEVPVFLEGNIIHLPGQTLEVVQACSGLRSMTSLVTLSAVFAYFTLKTNVLRGILFVAGVPVAVLVNVIRVVMMICAFHFLNYDLTEGTLHTVFGVLIFIISLLLIFLLGRGLSRWDKSVA